MDIVKVEATSKCLHVIDEMNAKLMDEYAQLQCKKANANTQAQVGTDTGGSIGTTNTSTTANSNISGESIDRLERMALFHYDHLLNKIPSANTSTYTAVSSRYAILKSNVAKREASQLQSQLQSSGSRYDNGYDRHRNMQSMDVETVNENPSFCCQS